MQIAKVTEKIRGKLYTRSSDSIARKIVDTSKNTLPSFYVGKEKVIFRHHM